MTRYTERLDSHRVRLLSASLAVKEHDRAVVSERRRQAASDHPADIAGVLNQAKPSFRFAYPGLAELSRNNFFSFVNLTWVKEIRNK